MNRQEFISRCKAIAGCHGVLGYIIDGAPDEDGHYTSTELPPIEKMTTFEAGKIYDFLEEHDLFKKEVKEEVYPTPTKISEILMVEDGSCDVESLKKQGYKIIVYRQGSRPPYFMEDNRSNNSYYAGTCLLTKKETEQ